MQTTNLFVELVVIGVGSAIWLGLFVLAVFKYTWIPVARSFSIPEAIPALAVVYVLGIITDRIADVIFDNIFNKLIWKLVCQKKPYRDYTKGDFYEYRNTIWHESKRFGDLYEYGRSRQRICRGWALNALLIAIALDCFVLTNSNFNQSNVFRIAMFGTLFLLSLALAAAFSWGLLTYQQYKKVMHQAEFVRKRGASPAA